MKWIYRFILYCLQPLLYPLTNGILPLFIPLLRERRAFENKNKNKNGNAIENQNHWSRANVLFEVSSEGELEQVRPLIEEFLKRNLLVEVVFCSPSVEKSLTSLASIHPNQLRIFRLPLLTYWPRMRFRSLQGLITAKTFIVCRYDFFPEIMLYGMQPDVQFFLLSATVKNRNFLRGQSPCQFLSLLYWRSLYHSFDQVIAATQQDKRYLQEQLLLPPEKVEVFDFRILQIWKRIQEENKEKTLSHFPDFYFFWKTFLEHYPREKRVIFGSFWPLEAKAFNHREFKEEIKQGKLLAVVFPHSLKEESLLEALKKIGEETQGEVPLYKIGPEELNLGKEHLQNIFSQMQQKPGILIITLPGLLCEMYTFFGHAFVGGGHGRSIHSVLEPYLAMTHIYIGPKTFRSTEYDFVRENSPEHIHVVEELQTFFSLAKQCSSRAIDREHRVTLALEAGPFFTRIMDKIW